MCVCLGACVCDCAGVFVFVWVWQPQGLHILALCPQISELKVEISSLEDDADEKYV